jgi:C-terminal processing protease CtpA/Prc
MRNPVRNGVRFLLLMTLFSLLIPLAQSQQMSNFDRDRALLMLDNVAKEIQKHYYDPKFHGVDWDATVRDAKQRIKASTSFNMALAHIAQAVVSLNDSHTFFLPPSRPYVHDYGYQTIMIGDHCYIIRVRPGSDAETKGLKPGDELLTLDGYSPDRENLWKMEYRYNVLRPELRLQLALRDVQGQQSQVEVMAKFKELARVKDVTGNGIWGLVRDAENQQHLLRPRWAEVGDDVLILKLPVFMLDQSHVEEMIDKARKRPALILDLRDNPGGAVDTLKYLLGGIFEKDVKIGDRVGRKEFKPEIAKSLNHGVFAGKVVVLIDSRSASAAELFARIVQIEKRGVVVGDRSSGSVMEAKRYTYSEGADVKVFYGAEITESDLIMSDGKSLEHRGVTPDELVLPTAADLRAGRDPVLSRAAGILGAKLTPEDAGKLFPYEWPKE